MFKRALFLPLVIVAVAPCQAAFPSQIKNIIVIVQENRTPDNMFHFITPACPIPRGAKGYQACMPSPVTTSCYDVSPCGLSNQSGTVVAIPLTGVSVAATADPSHTHTAFNQMCDPDSSFRCRNDGAWKTLGSNGAYTYVLNPAVTNYDGSKGHLLDPYLTFAEQYGWANFMYQTNQGPSYPAHQFLFTGSSGLTDTDDADSIFVAENFNGITISPQAGCLLAPSTASAPTWNWVVQPATGSSKGCPLFDANSVQECKVFNTKAVYPTQPVGNFCSSPRNLPMTVLDPHGISWKYYAPSGSGIWAAPNAILPICEPQFVNSTTLQCTGAEWNANMDTTVLGTGILTDIANCSLPEVSWVIPNGPWSDHAGTSGGTYGPSWVAAVINAIGNNPTCPAKTPDAGQTFWKDTAILVTWDDWGGYTDNQPAIISKGLPCVFTKPATPCPADYQMGFRVPLVVVSAYTPQGFISNTPHDFGSILRMIEGVHGLPEGMMGNADARSTTDLSEFFRLATPRAYQTVPAQKNAAFFQTYKGAALAPDND